MSRTPSAFGRGARLALFAVAWVCCWGALEVAAMLNLLGAQFEAAGSAGRAALALAAAAFGELLRGDPHREP